MSSSDWIFPAHGRIEGGRLDGHNYAFLKVERRSDGEIDVLVRVTPPHWPFPREAYLDEAQPELLRRLPGSRVPRVDFLAHAKRLLLEETVGGAV